MKLQSLTSCSTAKIKKKIKKWNSENPDQCIISEKRVEYNEKTWWAAEVDQSGRGCTEQHPNGIIDSLTE